MKPGRPRYRARMRHDLAGFSGFDIYLRSETAAALRIPHMQVPCRISAMRSAGFCTVGITAPRSMVSTRSISTNRVGWGQVGEPAPFADRTPQTSSTRSGGSLAVDAFDRPPPATCCAPYEADAAKTYLKPAISGICRTRDRRSASPVLFSERRA